MFQGFQVRISTFKAIVSVLTGTFQRIRGAIDARIAEEQAKQRTTPSVPPRGSVPPRRSNSRNLSPSKRPGAKVKDADSKAALPAGRGPDPSEFDPEFVIGEGDDQPSRTGTPKPKEQAPAAETTTTAEDGSEKKEDSEKPTDTDEKSEKPPEIPPEVQTRLRRLDKLEPKYVTLLSSYRIAHARVGAIETFEASLREYTPLTSINDASAFVEYLGQLNVKSDMLMEELKRVSKERDGLNKKLEVAEKRAKEATEEVETLKSQTSSKTDASKDDSTEHGESIAPSSASKTTEQTETTDATEEFFSYDSELPRLQEQL